METLIHSAAVRVGRASAPGNAYPCFRQAGGAGRPNISLAHQYIVLSSSRYFGGGGFSRGGPGWFSCIYKKYSQKNFPISL
ncbi:MAG: hypothetical protein LBU39_00665 [Desulfobulbaceae bacterium]|nr:hypothetical protein [Desulfobulbaceae bacterium]